MAPPDTCRWVESALPFIFKDGISRPPQTTFCQAVRNGRLPAVMPNDSTPRWCAARCRSELQSWSTLTTGRQGCRQASRHNRQISLCTRRSSQPHCDARPSRTFRARSPWGAVQSDVGEQRRDRRPLRALSRTAKRSHPRTPPVGHQHRSSLAVRPRPEPVPDRPAGRDATRHGQDQDWCRPRPPARLAWSRSRTGLSCIHLFTSWLMSWVWAAGGDVSSPIPALPKSYSSWVKVNEPTPLSGLRE